MLSEDEMHELEILAHLEEKDFNNNTCHKSYIDLVMNAGKKSFEIITKLQKENKKLKDKNKDLLRKLRNRIKEVKKLTKYSQYKKEFSRLNKQLRQKDKQVDLMAEYVFNKNKAQLIIEYGIENKEQLIKEFEKEAKEKGE